MNVNTNELVNLGLCSLKEQEELMQNNDFLRIPEDLEADAAKLLKNKKKVKIPFKSNGSLAKWAEKVRENQKNGKNSETNRF